MTRIYYSIFEDFKWVDYLEINNDTIYLSSNSDTLLTHGLVNKNNKLPAIHSVCIPKVDNKIKVPVNLNNGKIYDLVLDVSKDDNIEYYDMFINESNKQIHIIYRTYYTNDTSEIVNIFKKQHAFVIQATDQGFYVINFFQGVNEGFMYFMLDNDFNKCYKVSFTYKGNPLNFLCTFKKFLDPNDVVLANYNTDSNGIVNNHRYISNKHSILAEYPVPFYVEDNKIILCPELDCKENVTCFIDNGKPIEYHYSILRR